MSEQAESVTAEYRSSSLPTVLAIFASIFLLGAGSALQTTAISLRAGIEGFSEPMIGIISSSYYGGMLLGSLLALIMIRNVGYVRTFAAFASLASATSLVHVIVIIPFWWVLFRLVHGMCLAIVLVVVESWLNTSAPNKSRGRILSIYGIVFLAAYGLAQPLLGVFEPEGFSLFGITSILISMCVLPIGLTRVKGEAPQVMSIKINVVGMFKKTPMGSSGVIISGLVAGAHLTLTPRFAQTINLSSASIGTLLLVASLGTIVLQLPLGWISDHTDRRFALIISSGGGAVAAIGLAFAGEMGMYLMVMGFLLGGFMLPLYSLALATVNDQLAYEEMIEAASALYIFYGVGSMAGPLIAAWSMGRFGPAALYWFILLILLLYLGFGLLRVHLMPDFLVRGAKTRFRSVPRTSLVAYNLLRRPLRKKPGAPKKGAHKT
ncbi:MAG: MFS transporter [Spirochaetaceae bacterium]